MLFRSGDTKPIVINGKVGNFTFSNLTINPFILGFNHNSAKEGTKRIHWLIGKISGKMVGLCDNNYGSNVSGEGYFHMNTSNTNVGGWKDSYMRKTLLGNSNTPTSPLANSLMAALPSDLRAVMKAVTKYTDNVGNNTGHTAGNVTSTSDYLFLLSNYEVQGNDGYANSYEKNSQLQYDYFKAGNSKVAYKHSATGTAVWWLRSPYYSSYNTFCTVTTDGTYTAHHAYYSAGLLPCLQQRHYLLHRRHRRPLQQQLRLCLWGPAARLCCLILRRVSSPHPTRASGWPTRATTTGPAGPEHGGRVSARRNFLFLALCIASHLWYTQAGDDDERGEKMSVLKNRRVTSKADFVNVASEIYDDTIAFLTRLSARYSRLMAEPVAKLAGEVEDFAEKANSIFPSDPQRIDLRIRHLLEARASLMALDVRLNKCYRIMSKNPEGCFTTSTGRTVDAGEAAEKLEAMADNLGAKIDRENDLLKGQIESTSKRRKK